MTDWDYLGSSVEGFGSGGRFVSQREEPERVGGGPGSAGAGCGCAGAARWTCSC